MLAAFGGAVAVGGGIIVVDVHAMVVILSLPV